VLDVSKAFDTIPHTAITVALERKGIPSTVANYIVKMYADCQTAIKTRDGMLNVKIKRGVKQGDPLSPLLFNLIVEPILEPILELVQNRTRGIEVEGHNLAAMAFADDIVLLTDDPKAASSQTQLVDSELGKRGMSLSIEKSSAFQYVPRNKTWYVKNPELVVREKPIPYNEPEKAFRYLGAKITPWKGLMEGFEISTFQDIIDRVRTLPIKPMQKVDLLRTYLLPRYTYGLIARPPSKEVLKSIDVIIREGIKKMLHLHETTSSAYLYTPRKEGVLGLLEIGKQVLLAALRNGVKAMQSSDDVVRDSLANDQIQKKYSGYAAALRLAWPVTIKQLDDYKVRLRKSYREQLSQQMAQGQGSEDFAYETISNAWLSRSDLLRSSRLIDAIKLRTNTYPTRVVMKRAHDNVNPICRACGEKDETLGHILGQCPHTKPKRIKRHNEIVNLIKERLAKSGRIMTEPVIEHEGERYKPDLVIVNEEGLLVLDVTVRYENKDFLAAAAREKIEKYKHIALKLKNELKAKNARVVPIVIGSRGALPKNTVLELKRLKIPKKDWLTMSMTALRSSIENANAFMDA